MASHESSVMDSTAAKHGDSTFITVVSHHEVIPPVNVIEYLRITIWPIVAIIFLFVLRNRITEFEGFGFKGTFNKEARKIQKIREQGNVI